jgi:plasmid replication initiation protein
MDNAAHQLALALFEDYSPRGDSVTNAPNDLGFRRSNAFVKIVDLSLAGRRLVDVAYFLVAEDSETRREYRVDFGLFKWLMCTTSNNRRHLTKLIREAQKAAIELTEVDVNDPARERWGAIPLMGAAFVDSGEFIFSIDDRLQRAIKNPTASHFLSLRYVFRSIHSKVLFDRLQPFMADGVTPWFEVGALRAWMDCEKKTYDLFKHFRNKVLDPAISEIREVTGVQVEMLTNNVPGSKRIGQLRFRLQASQPSDAQKTVLIVLKSLYETLRKEFALTQDEFNEIITNRSVFTDERINQAIEYTRHNVKIGKVKLRAGGYFMKALREGYLLGELDKQIHQQSLALESAQQTATQHAEAREERLEAAAETRARQEADFGWACYSELTADEQSDMVGAFCRSQAARLVARRIKVEAKDLPSHLNDAGVRRAFGAFVAGKAKRATRAAHADDRVAAEAQSL